MTFKLNRKSSSIDGVFGVLLDAQDNEAAVTLEHAYEQPDSTYKPKVPVGVYICKRGQHQLEHMTQPFSTFEIMNVPNHTNILFHVGNYNHDSDGCVLLGEYVLESAGEKVITHSKITFDRFMNLLRNENEFQLTVTEEA